MDWVLVNDEHSADQLPEIKSSGGEVGCLTQISDPVLFCVKETSQKLIGRASLTLDGKVFFSSTDATEPSFDPSQVEKWIYLDDIE